MPRSPERNSLRWPLAAGLAAGVALDALFGDPRRGHPVAAFGGAASALESRTYADSRVRGAAHATACLLGAVVPAVLMHRRTRGRPPLALAAAALATWAVTGARSLHQEAERALVAVTENDLESARKILPNLCGRDPGGLDDAANWIPARVTAALTIAVAPLVASGRGSRPAASVSALRAVLRDGGRHPSPNAGRCEAAFAGALGVRLGGTNVYEGVTEARPSVGQGRAPEPDDARRAIRLSRAVTVAATALAVLIALARPRR